MIKIDEPKTVMILKMDSNQPLIIILYMQAELMLL